MALGLLLQGHGQLTMPTIPRGVCQAVSMRLIPVPLSDEAATTHHVLVKHELIFIGTLTIKLLGERTEE
jgi:hypothetical protein